MKVGERFQIEYDPDADLLGIFQFLERAWFEVVEIRDTEIKIKQVKP